MVWADYELARFATISDLQKLAAMPVSNSMTTDTLVVLDENHPIFLVLNFFFYSTSISHSLFCPVTTPMFPTLVPYCPVTTLSVCYASVLQPSHLSWVAWHGTVFASGGGCPGFRKMVATDGQWAGPLFEVLPSGMMWLCRGWKFPCSFSVSPCASRVEWRMNMEISNPCKATSSLFFFLNSFRPAWMKLHTTAKLSIICHLVHSTKINLSSGCFFFLSFLSLLLHFFSFFSV